MLKTIAIIALTLFTSVPNVEAQQCRQRKVRREWHDLEISEKVQYANCVRTLYSDGELWRMCKKHEEYSVPGHQRDYFYPFHRLFLKEWEDSLERYGCWTEGLPYWDSTYEHDNWYNSEIWAIFGNLNGEHADPNNRQPGCISAGWFNGFLLAESDNCVLRNSITGTLYSAAQMATDINTINEYPGWRARGENGNHAQVHVQVGGSMNNLRLSACDPIFWVHHGAVDRHWALWQSRGREFQTYPGDVNAPAPGFEVYNWTIQHTLGNFRDDLCYEYQRPYRLVGEEPPSAPIGSSPANPLRKRSPAGLIPPPTAKTPKEAAAEPSPESSPDGTTQTIDPKKAKLAKESVEAVKEDLDLPDPVSETDSDPAAEEAVKNALIDALPVPVIVDIKVPPVQLDAKPIVLPPPLPASYIRENGLNESEIRSNESDAAQELELINKTKEENDGISGVKELALKETVAQLDLVEAVKDVPVLAENVGMALEEAWEATAEEIPETA